MVETGTPSSCIVYAWWHDVAMCIKKNKCTLPHAHVVYQFRKEKWLPRIWIWMRAVNIDKKFVSHQPFPRCSGSVCKVVAYSTIVSEVQCTCTGPKQFIYRSIQRCTLSTFFVNYEGNYCRRTKIQQHCKL